MVERCRIADGQLAGRRRPVGDQAAEARQAEDSWSPSAIEVGPPAGFLGGRQPRLVDAGIECQRQRPAGRLVEFDDKLLLAVVDGQVPLYFRGDDQPGADLLPFGRCPGRGRFETWGSAGPAPAQRTVKRRAGRVVIAVPFSRAGRRPEACGTKRNRSQAGSLRLVPDPVLQPSYAEGLVATGWGIAVGPAPCRTLFDATARRPGHSARTRKTLHFHGPMSTLSVGGRGISSDALSGDVYAAVGTRVRCRSVRRTAMCSR